MSELRNLIWISRIARPDALYDASVLAQSLEDVVDISANKSDSEEKVSEMDSLKAGRFPSSGKKEEYSHIRGIGEF